MSSKRSAQKRSGILTSVAAAAKSAGDYISTAIYGTKHHPYKMLLIGETGSGKTSFLNLLCNCGLIQALGCQFDENGFANCRRFNDLQLETAPSHEVSSGKSQSSRQEELGNLMQSKTSGAKLYNTELNGLEIGIIDTPGFGDTRGTDQDKRHIRAIIDTLQNESYINCVCLVINGRISRMSANLRYILSQITSILPRDVLNNVIIVFTNTSDPLELNFQPSALQPYFGKKIDRIFIIENPYCKLEKAKERQDDLPMDMIATSLRKSFEQTAEVLNKMHEQIRKFEAVHTNKFLELYNKKQKIEKGVITLLSAYDHQKEIEKMITQAQEEADAAVRQKDLNTNFRSTKQYKRHKPVDTPEHNTLCGAPGCHSNCHISCNLAKCFDRETFKECKCMFGGDGYHCTVCGHHYSYHYHNEVMWEKEEYTKHFVDEVMKKKFKEARSMEERACIFSAKLEEERRQSKQEKERLSLELLRTIEEFHKLGVNRNYAQLIENQLTVIDLRLQDALGSEMEPLMKMKQELEKKLMLVKSTLNEPMTAGANSAAQREWACHLLGIDPYIKLTKEIISKAFREMSKSHHPDRSGETTYFQRIEYARSTLMDLV